MFTKEDTLKVKGIAIILLLFHHLFIATSRIEANGIKFLFCSQDFIQQIAAGARICVWIFAFLSAYGLSIQYLKNKDNESSKNFILRHWFSLLKPYWFIYLIFLGLSFVFFQNPVSIYQQNVLYAVLDFFGISDFFGTPILVNVWWYMCLAQCILICIPLLNKVCQISGYATFFIAFILMQYLSAGIHSESGGSYINYFLVIVLGVLCAQNNFFEKASLKSRYKILNFFEAVLLFCGFVFFMYLRVQYSNVDKFRVTTAFCGFSVLCICLLSHKYLNNKCLKKILTFLGKHSGNIFMTHTFVYLYYPELIYWSKNVIVSWISLICLSCIISFVLEKIKSIIKYNEGINRIQSFLLKSKI